MGLLLFPLPLFSFNILSMPTLFLDLAGTLVDLEAYRRGEIQDLCFLEEILLEDLALYSCVLVTASPQAQVESVLRLTGLDKRIPWAELITAERGGDQKASGAPFEVYLSFHPGRAVHVGDSDPDEEGAKKAHIPFVRVNPQPTFSLQQQELTRVLREAMDILGR